MMNRLIFLLLWIPCGLQAQSCDCASNFEWLKQTFEKNDAGFAYALNLKGQDAYEQHNEQISQKIRNISKIADCGQALNEWLTFFRPGHLGVVQIAEEEKPNKSAIRNEFINWESLEVDVKAFESYLSSKDVQDFEGIWETSPYKIGIKKVGTNYVGFIIKADGTYWTEGQVKLKITVEQGRTSAVYYMKDHTAEHFKRAELLGNNYLQIGFITLKRIYPNLQEDAEVAQAVAQYIKSMEAVKPYFEQLDSRTALLRIPSFDHRFKKLIDKVISAHKADILHTENLIIDLRNNGGGSDASFRELLPFLYTNPIRTVGMMFLSTPLNNQRMLDFINKPEYGFDEEDKKWARAAYDTLSQHIGEFVNLDTSLVSITTFDTIFPYPKHIGILINEGNGSTTEQFLLAARQSKKVKLFGTTTSGILDISNMYVVDSPCKEFRLYYALSKSLRIPEMAIDGKGIQPDYYLDESIPAYLWTEYVRQTLNEENSLQQRR